MSRVKVNEITNKVATGPVDFPDGITGVALTATGNVTAGIGTFTTSIVVGSAVTANSDGIIVGGAVTATSFAGDGSSLTGVASTDNINTSTPASFVDINATGIVTAAQFVPTTGHLGNSNIIINGAMRVAQRGTSSTTSGAYTIDRMRQEFGGTDEAPTYAQVDVASGTTPYTLGFRKALKVTNGNQTGGAGAADYIQIDYRFEAQDIANSGWNYTSSSSNLTLSFWIKSSVAQDTQVVLRTQDGTSQSFQFKTGTLSADTWTKVTKTIPGHANLQFDNDANHGLNLFWFPYIGTDYVNDSNTLDGWMASSGTTYGRTDTTTWYTTNDATYELTGIQLEVGSVATPFQFRSYAEELRLCQRYYKLIANNNGGTATESFALGCCNDAAALHTIFDFEPEMRTTPTADVTTGTNYFSIIETNSGQYSSTAPTSVSSRSSPRHFELLWPIDGSTGTAGAAGFIYTADNSAWCAFTAEF